MQVNIILCCYKPEKYIFETIESILRQKYKEWLLTIVDDASPGISFDEVKYYLRGKDRIRIIELTKNLRAPGARMKAISHTEGDIVAFIDQDDIWAEDKLVKQVEIFKKYNDVIAVHTNVEHIDCHSMVLGGHADKENKIRNVIAEKKLGKEEMAIELFKRNFIRLSSSALRRDVFLRSGGFNTMVTGGEDDEFWVRFANHGKIYHLEEKLTYRRIHKNNVSSKYALPRMFGKLKGIDINIRDFGYLKPFYRQKKGDILIRAVKKSKKMKRIDYYCFFRFFKLINNLSGKIFKNSGNKIPDNKGQSRFF
jgi:glycosyltransferase involved in cell wall biosynthesis